MTKLIELSKEQHKNLPRTSQDEFFGVRKIQRMVRACILADRDLEEIKRQVFRDHGFSNDVRELVEFFNVSERA